MMKPIPISLKLARKMALHAQWLNSPRLPKGKEGVARIIEHLGYVQIDTIAVVERAHHHTLWNRKPDYQPKMLDDLLARDRRIFEYWGHAASYLPMSDYRFYLRKMERYRKMEGKWEKKRLEIAGPHLKPVMERIQNEGPLAASDFSHDKNDKPGGWWEWKPAKIALEILFWWGDLMISRRRNFQRVYDLTERVLPAGVDTRMPDKVESGRFFVKRALNAHGIVREKEIRDHLRGTGNGTIARALAQLTESGEVTRVHVKDRPGNGDYYVVADTLEKIQRRRNKPRRVSLLSPFDNLIIQRERLRQLFDFDYTIECYVPAAKRRYGYFTLPILWGDRFAGRLDPKADRRSKTLIIRHLEFEPGIKSDDTLLQGLSEALIDYAGFNGCENIKLQRVVPKGVKGELLHCLKLRG